MARYLDDGGDATVAAPVKVTPELAAALEKINADVPVITGDTTEFALTPYAELTAEERKAMTQEEKLAYIDAAREQSMANKALERAASNPMLDFSNRPDAPSSNDNYINYYSWVGGATTGEWKLYRAPNTPENQATYGSRSVGGPTQATPNNPVGANALLVQPQPIRDQNGNITGWDTSGNISSGNVTAKNPVVNPAVNPAVNPTVTSVVKPTGVPTVTSTVNNFTATDGRSFTSLADQLTYQATLDKAKNERQSAYDLLYSEFSRYGLGSLVEPLKGLIQQGVSPSEFTIQLRNTPQYQRRFAANAKRVQNGLKALSEAEYIGLEDQYQNIMRNYGLPEQYYSRGDLGVQQGFEQFIGNDVSPVELEDRIQTAERRVRYANPEVGIALRTFYPDITNGDVLAYALDPKTALESLKRRITAAEVGSTAVQMGLATNVTDAEYLARYGVTKPQAQQGYQTIANFLPRASMLSDVYATQGVSPYTQATAEKEVFGVPGAAEAAAQRKKIVGLETAAFSGSSGAAGGALARERAGGF